MIVQRSDLGVERPVSKGENPPSVEDARSTRLGTKDYLRECSVR